MDKKILERRNKNMNKYIKRLKKPYINYRPAYVSILMLVFFLLGCIFMYLSIYIYFRMRGLP